MSVYPAALPTVRPAVRSAFEQGSGGGAASIIAGLFAQGQQGFWLPFTDFASLTQDSAGTLPYTAVEQPVGRVLDKSGRGNHATQPTSTARGKVSARVNLLQNSALTGFVAGSPGLKPTDWGLGFGGGTTASNAGAIRLSATAARQFVFQDFAGVVGVSYSCVATIEVHGGAVSCATSFGTNSSNPAISSYYLDGVLVADTNAVIPNGLHLLEWRFTHTNAPLAFRYCAGVGIQAPATGDVTIFRVDLRSASQAALPYQRVNTPTDYDSVGFPKYASLDGVDDFYTCGGGGSTTGFFYSDVVRLNSSNTQTLFSNILPNRGYLALIAIGTNKPKLFAGNGTAFTQMDSIDALVVGVPSCVQMWDDGVNLNIQINDGAIASTPRPAVLAGPSTMSLYYGGGAAYFNGQVTEPIYRAGPPPSAYERSVIRGYQMQKAGL